MPIKAPKFVRENIKRLKDECSEENLSITSLCKLTGIARKIISRYTNGTVIPQPKNYNKLAEFFHWRRWSYGFDDIPTLKPCPFCGDEAGILKTCPQHRENREYVVQCWGCNAKTNYFSSPDDAADAWNRRA